MSCINPTLPHAEMNKKRESVRVCVSVCVLHVRSCVWNVPCILIIMCYHAKLELASENAYDFNDRPGTSVDEKMYFFII